MEDNYIDNIFDSMNITGQWQPSLLPNIQDPSLNSQILDDIVLSADDSLTYPTSTNNDDISNALIDAPMDLFNSYLPPINSISDCSLDSDDITKLISSPIGEMPGQSIIENTMERMTLDSSHTDILSSSLSIQVGSSPVEQKEIDNSILARQVAREQERIYKNATKSRRTSGPLRGQQASSTVGPIDVLSSYGGCQPCSTAQLQNDFDYEQQLLQFDSIEIKKIQIKSQPRSRFRPRTQNESKYASHYIRCDDNSQYDYPTIYIPYTWISQSIKNIIEITLVRKDKQPHPYKIENKNCNISFDDNSLIFRQNELNTLYFRVTDDDFKNGFKSFQIEYIKSKQDDTINKDLIKTLQLDQSMLRFTRYYQTEKDSYQRDDNSVEYSNMMCEAYSDVSVEHVGPRFGPMGGNETVYALLKGRTLKDDITIFVTEDMTGWRQQVSCTKNGNLIYFSMPPFPFSQFDSATVNITIYYKGEELYQSAYLYKGSLDQDLAQLNLNESTSTTTSGPSSSNMLNAFDFFAATGVCPVPSSSRKSSTSKRTKRLNNK